MIFEKFKLSDKYPFLNDYNSEAIVEIYIQEDPVNQNGSSPRKGMVVCPGSGYRQCARIESEPVASKLLAMGFNVFVITYSCDPVRHPAQILEVAALYDLIAKNKDEWNTDVERTGIMGFSAGGHLAAHYSNKYNCSEIMSKFESVHKPYTTILGYPVISADPEIRHEGSFMYLLGHVPSKDEIDAFSCERMVSDDTPPTFIWHTVEDKSVPVQNSLRYAEALSNHGIDYTLHIYPYGPHGLSTVDNMSVADVPEKVAYGHDWLRQLEKWVELIY